MHEDAIHKFRATDSNELYGLLVSRGALPEEEAGTLVHALLDVSESIEKVYCSLVPRLLSVLIDQDVDPERLEEVLWDIQDEFRHIDYQIHDAGLANP